MCTLDPLREVFDSLLEGLVQAVINMGFMKLRASCIYEIYNIFNE